MRYFSLQTCSEQVPLGAHDQKRPSSVVFDSGESLRDSPPQDEVEWFLSMLQFESREKVEELVTKGDITA